MQETQVWYLGWEDPLKKEMAAHSSTLAWRIPWRSLVVHEVAKNQTWLSDFTFTFTSSKAVPYNSGSQSILKEISPEYSLEGLLLKLKLQYFGHLMQRTDSLEKTLMLGEIEGRRRRGRQKIDGRMASLTQWTWVWASSGSWWRTGKPDILQSTGLRRVGHDWVTELNWTDTH